MKLLSVTIFLLGAVSSVYSTYSHPIKALKPMTCECGWTNPGTNDGNAVAENEYPWVASLVRKDEMEQICGGTIITSWHVLSTAKCTNNIQASDTQIVVGSNDVTNYKSQNNAKMYNIEKITTNELYHAVRIANDISILTTATQIEINKFVGPACFPKDTVVEMLNAQKVSTFGYLDGKSVKKLQKLELEVVTNTECTIIFKAVKAPVAHICLSKIGDTCSSNHGASMTYLDSSTQRYMIAGLVSYKYHKCQKTASPIFNTFVPPYESWITEAMKAKPDAQLCMKS